MKKLHEFQEEEILFRNLNRMAISILRLSAQGGEGVPFFDILSLETRKNIALLKEKSGFKVFVSTLCRLNDCLEAASLPQRNPSLQRLNDYVEANYMNSISVSDVASVMCMSEASLYRFLKKEIGMTLVDYVNKFRVEQAARQLSETDDSVSGIGYNCGFNTIDYFIRIFKKVKGCTPGRFRV